MQLAASLLQVSTAWIKRSLLLRSLQRAFEDGSAIRIEPRFVLLKAMRDRCVIWNKFAAEAKDIRLAGPTLRKAALLSQDCP
jgi:hypothetical protein